MAGYIYPTVAEAVEIHRQLIEEFGGSYGLLDQGRLEAALSRPQTGYYNNLLEKAAALMESLANNHPFLDGNKRVSFALADTFLRVNGFYLEVDPSSAHKFITEAIGTGEFRFDRIREWISSHVKPLEEP
jgi:death-on-curing protein